MRLSRLVQAGSERAELQKFLQDPNVVKILIESGTENFQEYSDQHKTEYSSIDTRIGFLALLVFTDLLTLDAAEETIDTFIEEDGKDVDEDYEEYASKMEKYFNIFHELEDEGAFPESILDEADKEIIRTRGGDE